MSIRRVCWISNAPSPYKVDFMNLLGKDVDLTCLFETRAESDREKSWYNYQFTGFHAVYLDGPDAREIIRAAAADSDCLIDSDYSRRLCMYAQQQFHKRGKTVFLHADGGLAVPRGPVDWAISMVMKRHDWFLSSGEQVDRYFRYYGVSPEKILRYRISCMDAAQMRDHGQLRQHKEECRSTCGYREKIILLSVGQPIPRKGYDILVRAMQGLGEELGLYIVGGGPEPSVKAILEETRPDNIHFVPFKSQKELASYYAGADMFVLPTRYDIWGLVINEAMSFGLPVISTDRCVAAMEFEALFKNALIVPAEDAPALREAVRKLAGDERLREELGRNSWQGIQPYTLESMKEDFLHILAKADDAV